MDYIPQISPRPWHIEEKEYFCVNKQGKNKHKAKAWFIVDANGRDVWRTATNMQHICDCVNKAQEETSHEPAGL